MHSILSQDFQKPVQYNTLYGTVWHFLLPKQCRADVMLIPDLSGFFSLQFSLPIPLEKLFSKLLLTIKEEFTTSLQKAKLVECEFQINSYVCKHLCLNVSFKIKEEGLFADRTSVFSGQQINCSLPCQFSYPFVCHQICSHIVSLKSQMTQTCIISCKLNVNWLKL